MWLTLWKKKFLLLFIPFYWFEKKKVVKKNLNFLMVRKTNFLSISVLVSTIVTFMSKKKGSLRISFKMLQNNRKA